MTRPYERAALTYLARGWAGVLPLPAAGKFPPPEGYTGIDGRDPSGADVYAWCEDRGHGNIALRLPDGVIGLDVDDYDGRGGGVTLARGERVWGALPATWRASSRLDGLSGVRLYRVPVGRRFLGTFGPGTEVVQRAHRYVVAPPSVHPDGRTYRWHGPDGGSRGPAVDELPTLPAAWVSALTVPDAAARGRRAPRARQGRRARRPEPVAPARPTVDTLAARTKPAPAEWVAAMVDDHLRQLRRATTPALAYDHAAAAGYLVEQATLLGVAHRDDLDARLADALERAPGPMSANHDAAHTGRDRATARPWRLTPA